MKIFKILLASLFVSLFAGEFAFKFLAGHWGGWYFYLPFINLTQWLYEINLAPEWLIKVHNDAIYVYGEIYNWPVEKSYIFIALIGAASIFVLAIYFLSTRITKSNVSKSVVSGMQFVSAKKYSKIVNSGNKKNKRFSSGIFIHPQVQLSREAETEHISCIGTTGAAKTSAILSSIIKQTIQRGDKVILFDVKGDFTEALAGYENVDIMAPWDERSVKWDLLREIRNSKDCELLASSFVFKEKAEGGAGKEDFFVEQAQIIFTAILTCLLNDGQLSWDKLKEYTISQEKLIGREGEGEWLPGLLHRYESARTALDAINRGSDQTQATWTTLQGSVGKWIRDAQSAFGDNPDFCLTDWLEKKDGGVLVLRVDETFHSFSTAMCVSMAALAIKRMLQMPEDDHRVWLIMDELSNFPKIPNLKRGLTLGRDRGLRCVVATQDVTQLYDVYGKNEAHTFINQCNNQIWLRANDHKNADLAAQSLGFCEAEVKATGKQFAGGEFMSNKNSQNYSIVRETVVNPGELESLRHSRDLPRGGAEGFIRISGVPAVTKLHWERQALEKRFPKDVLAEWVFELERQIL